MCLPLVSVALLVWCGLARAAPLPPPAAARAQAQALLARAHAAGVSAQEGAAAGAPPAVTSPRLPPPPSPQQLETLRKVAQLLVMLGQQVIPAITGTAGDVSNAFDRY